MARNWIFLTILGFTLGFGAIFACWWGYRRCILMRSSSNDMPKWKLQSIRSRFPFWKGGAQKEYELVSRHEV